MTMYCWYQDEDQGRWHLSLASERNNLVRDKKAKLITALDADNTFSEILTAEQNAAVRYIGDFFADFDSQSIAEAITHCNMFVAKLKGKGVDPNQLRIYATGGRGFHVFIPMPLFMRKQSAIGVAGLPHIYKELAHQLFVEDLDLRIYSSKKGRQLRCTNVKRDGNGKYKVQVMARELVEMTPEQYEALCTEPRPEWAPEPATFNADLALLYETAKEKVASGFIKKAKCKKNEREPLKKFGKEWPETVKLILQNVIVRPDIGWNMISLQLGIAAAELGKSEDELIADASPLITEHKGDGVRYNTPEKRRFTLREQFRYVNDNPSFEYSHGGILSLVIPECRANCDLNLGEFVPDIPKAAQKVEVATGGAEDAEGDHVEGDHVEGEVADDDDEEDNAPIRVSKMGIYTRSEHGYVNVCAIGFGRATQLRRMSDEDIGYEIEVFKRGKPKGTHLLTMDKLLSKSAFQQWTFRWSASMSASDGQTSKLADVLSRRAELNNDITYVVEREGVDLVVKHGAKSEDDFELIFASPDKVLSIKGSSYRCKNDRSADGSYKSDLLNAPDLTTEDGDDVEHLLNVNTNENMGRSLGWFSSSFMCQIFRRYYRQFPILQVFGQAGAGKSKTVELLNHLHYYMAPPQQVMPTGYTQYAMKTKIASSASQPFVIEEVKGREMSKQLRDFLLGVFRSNYDGHGMANGTLSKESGVKEVRLDNFANVAPVAFVGEAMETQAAMLERCVIVQLTKNDREGRTHHYDALKERAHVLGKIGRAMMLNVLAIDIPEMRKQFNALVKEVTEAVGDKAHGADRPIFNVAVALMGLRLFKDTLTPVFGTRFDEKIATMHNAILANAENSMPNAMSEVARVIDKMAELTHNKRSEYTLVHGQEFTVSADGRHVDLKLKPAYAKYVAYQRSLGMEVLFDNETAFITAVFSYNGTVKKSCPDNPHLYDSPRAVIVRLSVDKMDKEGVDAFGSGGV